MAKKSGFISEFKKFIMRGNVIDLAVGVIVGGAFSAIVSSLTDDIINPLIGTIFKMDFSNLVANVNGAELRYGAFIMAITLPLLMNSLNSPKNFFISLLPFLCMYYSTLV